MRCFAKQVSQTYIEGIAIAIMVYMGSQADSSATEVFRIPVWCFAVK
jgi:hypothetical protein